MKQIIYTQSANYLLGRLNIKDAIVIVLFSFVSLILGIQSQGEFLVAITMLMSLFYSLNKVSMSLAFAVVSSPLIGELSSFFLQMLVYSPFIITSKVSQVMAHLHNLT